MPLRGIDNTVNQRAIRGFFFTQLGWGVHFAVYLIFCGLVVGDALNLGGGVGKMLLLGWFGLLGLHAFALSAGQSPAKAKREAESRDEKPKRHLELSDDGELIEIRDDHPDEQVAQRK